MVYRYDNSGALAQVEDYATGILTKYMYDLSDRLMMYEEEAGEQNHRVRYYYDSMNNLTKVREGFDGVNRTTGWRENMNIYVARHGQTQWNLENKVCGRTDQPLTEVGFQQAQLLAERTKDLKIDVIISSPLLRARQTAQPTAALHGLRVLVDDRLIEQNYGIYEGVSRVDEGFLSNKRHFACRYPGGESMMDVAHRVYGLLEEIKEKYAGKNVLLVCHGGVCRVIRTYFEDMTNEEYFHYSEENAAVREYEL